MCYTIQEVSADNWRQVIKLQVSSSQQSFIEPNAVSITESKYETRWVPVALYAGEELVGFAMYGKLPENGIDEVWLDRFMIDHRFQGRGYAKIFIRMLIGRLKQTYGCDKIFLSFYEDNKHAIRLYESLGFMLTDMRDCNGEIIAYCNV